MSDNKLLYKCPICLKSYKSESMLKKHKCKKVPDDKQEDSIKKNELTNKILAQQKVNELLKQKKDEDANIDESSQPPKENTYDVNMTFLENNKVKVEMKKQGESDEDESDDETSGENVLKGMLRPKISSSYQDEIDKLENLVKLFKNLPISDDPDKKDRTITQLKQTITILLDQSQKLIKEMQTMSKRNSYYRNNITLASFILDKCRKDAPETDEEFEEMFGA